MESQHPLPSIEDEAAPGLSDTLTASDCTSRTYVAELLCFASAVTAAGAAEA